jgi:hypothetical protein
MHGDRVASSALTPVEQWHVPLDLEVLQQLGANVARC